jgi:hypothetical protein
LIIPRPKSESADDRSIPSSRMTSECNENGDSTVYPQTTSSVTAMDGRASGQSQLWPFTEQSRLLVGSAPATGSVASGWFDLVQKFLKHLMVKNPERAVGGGGSVRYEIDWATVEACTTDCQTLEQAIGRAVVVADQMSRGVFAGLQYADRWPPYDANDTFFAFSLADVAADFGDESRYRKRVAKKVVGILGTRRKLVAT